MNSEYLEDVWIILMVILSEGFKDSLYYPDDENNKASTIQITKKGLAIA